MNHRRKIAASLYKALVSQSAATRAATQASAWSLPETLSRPLASVARQSATTRSTYSSSSLTQFSRSFSSSHLPQRVLSDDDYDYDDDLYGSPFGNGILYV